jgi:hypothetical protein
MAGVRDARCSHGRMRVRVEISEWALNWVTIGHNFPLFGLGGAANATSSSLAPRVLGIWLLSLQNGQGLRLRNATQTNPWLTIGWQKNCSP